MGEISSRLDKKGIAIISTPNVHNIWSRLNYLIFGVPINFNNRDVKEHINPVFQNVFETQVLRKAGLKIVKKHYNELKVPLINLYLPISGKLFSNNVFYVLQRK